MIGLCLDTGLGNVTWWRPNWNRWKRDQSVWRAKTENQHGPFSLQVTFEIPFQQRFVSSTVEIAVLSLKYRKHGSSCFSHTFNCVCASAYFNPKLNTSQIFLEHILHISYVTFLVETLQYLSEQTLICQDSWKLT